MDSAQRLKAAKTAVQAGQRQQARAMLQQLVADEPHHELAWLWLSDLAPDLEARIFALEQALAINPHRTRARQRLAALRQQHTAQAEQAAAHARQAAAQDRALALNGQRHAAYALLGERLQQQPDDAAAWRRLGELADAVEDQIVALTYALALEPAHVPARHRLTQLQRAHEDALAIGSAYERFGDLDNAIRFYRLAQKASDSSPDALIAQKRLQAARRFRKLYRRQKRPFSLPPLSQNHALAAGRAHEEQGNLPQAVVAYRAAADLAVDARERQVADTRLAAAEKQLALSAPRLTSPTVSVIRLTLGPLLLYLLLIFVHAGLHPLRVSPVLGLGALAVLAGSLLVQLVTAVPHHALGARLLGAPRRADRLTHALLHVLGLLLLLLPCLLLLFSAVMRLAIFQQGIP